MQHSMQHAMRENQCVPVCVCSLQHDGLCPWSRLDEWCTFRRWRAWHVRDKQKEEKEALDDNTSCVVRRTFGRRLNPLLLFFFARIKLLPCLLCMDSFLSEISYVLQTEDPPLIIVHLFFFSRFSFCLCAIFLLRYADDWLEGPW